MSQNFQFTNKIIFMINFKLDMSQNMSEQEQIMSFFTQFDSAYIMAEKLPFYE